MKWLSVSAAGDPERENEDALGVVPPLAWVIDGATPLDEMAQADGLSSAAAFSHSLGDVLAGMTPGRDLRTTVLDARDQVALPVGPEQPAWAVPSASLALAAFSAGSLRYAVVGDCRLVLWHLDGVLDVVADDRVGRMDAVVLQRLQSLQEDGLSHAEAMARCLPLLRANRTGSLREGGPTLFAQKGLRPGFLSGRLRWQHGDRLLLCSDGFARLVETLDVFASWQELLRQAEDGLDDVARELRALEGSDPDCVRFPRFKASDDASAILVRG